MLNDRTCPTCKEAFKPKAERQVSCSRKCSAALRERKKRAVPTRIINVAKAW